MPVPIRGHQMCQKTTALVRNLWSIYTVSACVCISNHVAILVHLK